MEEPQDGTGDHVKMRSMRQVHGSVGRGRGYLPWKAAGPVRHCVFVNGKDGTVNKGRHLDMKQVTSFL